MRGFARLQVKTELAERFRERATLRRFYPSEYLQYLLDLDESAELIQMNGSIFENMFSLLNQARNLKPKKPNGYPAFSGQPHWP
jgi:hypothetical protein